MIALMVVVGFFFRITIFLCRNTEIERQMRQIVSSVTNNGGELISELAFPYSIFRNNIHNTVMSRFKKGLKLEIHLHKAFFSGNRFLDSLHKSFLNQTSLDLRKKKWTFLNQDFTVFVHNSLYSGISI